MKQIFLVISLLLISTVLLVSKVSAQTCPTPAGCSYTYISVTINYPANLVQGYSSVQGDYTYGLNFNPAVRGAIYRTDANETDLDSKYNVGNGSVTAAVVNLLTSNFVGGKTYCNYTTPFAIRRSNGQRYSFPAGEQCRTIIPPTPTPTPTATPTPTLTPTPCPSPVPGSEFCACCTNPAATISPMEIIEKNGTVDVTIGVTNAGTGAEAATTVFSLRTTTGTGNATFDDGTISKSFTGNQSNVVLKIKGVTESSQVDNIIIEAKFGNVLLNSDVFTVAVISTLEFVEVDSTYAELDLNPGNGVSGTAQGKRIFPDKRNVADTTSTTDRSLIKVKATILPAILNAKVNFKTFDLDDPSATSAPIDTTGTNGDDNNRAVLGGTNAGLLTGSGCMTPPDRLKDCPTDLNGIYEATLKTTMQPGDNFAVVASLTDDYLSGIGFNSTDGTKLVDFDNKAIPISGEANSDNVNAVRTQMLTVWRNLHIEVDSMGQAHENYVRGNISGTTTILKGRTGTLNVTAADLELNRFEKGRLELATITSFMDVISNTSNTVTVKNSTSTDIVLAEGVNFQVLNQSGTRSALGSIATGQTITPMQTVTLDINGSVPLEVNLFSNGSMFITPTLTSLTVKSNTVNSVEVTNNNRLSVNIKDATYFRLYDDDDMDDNAPPASGGRTLVDGDEGDDVAESNLDLIQPNQTPCVANSINGKVLGQCNAFLSAYVIPEYRLFERSGSHTTIPFRAELSIADAVSIYNNSSYFNNLALESNPQFWTVYFLSAYQDAYNAAGNRSTGESTWFGCLGKSRSSAKRTWISYLR